MLFDRFDRFDKVDKFDKFDKFDKLRGSEFRRVCRVGTVRPAAAHGRR